MNKAFLLSLNQEADIEKQWDFGLLKDLLIDCNFAIENVGNNLPASDRACVVIPARHHKGIELEVNKELQKIDNVVLFLMGDEEAEFDIAKIEHKSIHIWVQNPHIGKHDDYNKLGTGYPQHMQDYIPKEYTDKTLDIYFAGQITHQRRQELAAELKNMSKRNAKIRYIGTKGFTQGEKKDEYYKHMSQAMIAPAPSGAVIPDSFRLFEALECMSIPIADLKTASGETMLYWDWLFEEIVLFPQLGNWRVLQNISVEQIDSFDEKIQEQTEWYLKYKRKLKHKIMEHYDG